MHLSPQIVAIIESMKKQRLDKYIADGLAITRKEARGLIYQGHVTINGIGATMIDYPVSSTDTIACKGETIACINGYRYYILNKPKGYITADRDTCHKTVMDLLPPQFRKAGIMPVGRLDMDTTGLLLFTNHGALTYRLLSPKREIKKIYAAKLDRPITPEDVRQFAVGLDLGDFVTKPARLYASDISPNHACVELTEGKYHQVKRMFEAAGALVLELHRQCFGPLSIDMEIGTYRELRDDEVRSLFASCNLTEE